MSYDGGNRRPLICYNCQQPGHTSRECPNRVGQNNRKRKERDNEPTTQHVHALGKAISQQLNNIRRSIVRIGDDNTSPLTNALQELVTAIRDVVSPDDIAYVTTTIVHALVAQPHKHTVHATLIALLSTHNAELLTDILRQMMDTLHSAVHSAQHSLVGVVLRALLSLSLVRLISPQPVLNALTQFLQRFPSDRSLYIAMSIIVWSGNELSELAEMSHVINEVNIAMSSRPAPPAIIKVFSDDISEDYLVNMWLTLTTADWTTLSVIPRPYHEMQEISTIEPRNIDIDIATGNEQETRDGANMGDITEQSISTPPSSSVPFPLPPDLHLFPDDYEPVTSLSPLNRYALMDMIHHILDIYQYMHKEGSQQLLTLCSSQQIQEQNISYYHLILESIFACLFYLPQTYLPLIYYATIIVDLFKLDRTNLPPVLGVGMNVLFERLDDLDVQCIDRLCQWFAIHLSNFAFVWPYSAWSEVVNTDLLTPQRLFVSELLERAVRLSWFERIQQAIEKSDDSKESLELLQLMPHQPRPAYRFADDTTSEFGEAANNIVGAIRAKATVNDMTTIVNAVTPDARAAVFVPALMECGNKSYSHIFTLLERYLPLLHSLHSENSDVFERRCVESICEYWQHSHQHVVVIVARFIEYRLVSGVSVLSWAFRQTEALHDAFTWEMIQLAIEQTIAPSRSPPVAAETENVLAALLDGLNSAIQNNQTTNGENGHGDGDDGSDNAMLLLMIARARQFLRSYHAMLHEYRSQVNQWLSQNMVHPALQTTLEQAFALNAL